MELGVRVRLRDVDTLDDVAVLTAPDPVEPGDLLASVDEVYVVEASPRCDYRVVFIPGCLSSEGPQINRAADSEREERR
jgi:hypothetical protein